MIYTSAIEQIRGSAAVQKKQQAENSLIPLFRLAKVTSLSSGRAYVQLYGEDTASTKLYPYIEGYKPTVGDDVLLCQQGSTFIIVGKISKDNITDNYYLLKSAADALYLTEAEGDAKYQPIGSSTTVKWVENNNFYVGFVNDTTNVFRMARKGSSGVVNLGDSSYRFGTLYIQDINMSGSFGDLSTGTITPSGSNKNLGSSSSKFSNAYLDSIYPTNIYGGKWKASNASGACDLEWSGTDTVVGVKSSGNVNLGTSSRQFGDVRAKQFYQNGTAISTSDRRKKTGIKGIARKYIDFFRKLKPRLFRFKDGESGRLHSGFIAQEVEEAAIDSGIDNKDLAFICIDENGYYGLRYEELIAIQTQVIQDLLKKVDDLSEKVEDLERIVKGGA